MKMKNSNSKAEIEGRKLGAKDQFCTLLVLYTRALGHTVQVGRKSSHEQNRLMSTKMRPARGKTALMDSDGFLPCAALFEKERNIITLFSLILEYLIQWDKGVLD